MSAPIFAKCGCPNCGNHLEFPVEAAGASVNCPHCTQLVRLVLPVAAEAPPLPEPPPVPEATPGSGPISAEDILAAFAGPIQKPRISIFYQLGLTLVAFMMVLLPLVYLALVGAAAYGVYYYATHFYGILFVEGGGARGVVVKLLLYVTPLFAGGVLVFFMIKPLLAGRAPRAQPLALNPEIEPTLFAFINLLCETVGAPKPRRIDIDCRLNASAGFRRGFASMFGHDLVLTIGLPLVAGMNLREFAGVIAHEFGHFTQGLAMRLSYVIIRINMWFARVAYERDAWDLRLEVWAAESEDGRLAILFLAAKFAVWCSRLVLKILMFIGLAVSCFLDRQMEYDADRYMIKVSGSEGLEAVMRRLAVLGAALGAAYDDMGQKWESFRRLPDNFPAYLTHHLQQVPPAQRQEAEDTMGLGRTGLFDTHPANGDRIRRARQAEDPGIFQLDLPASILFSNFEAVSKQVTLLHYTEDLGIPSELFILVPLEEATAPDGGTGEAGSAGRAPRRLRLPSAIG
jgi:Zn-dependent protease with chaperone function